MKHLPLVMIASWMTAVVGFLMAVAFGAEEWLGTVGVVLITIAFAFNTGRRRFVALGPRDIPDFLTIFLLFQVLNKLLTLASLIALGDSGDVGVGAVESRFRWQAEWVFLISTILFWAGWRAVGSHGQGVLPNIPRARTLFITYGIAIAAYLMLGPLLDLSSVGGLTGIFRSFALGVIAILLYAEGPFALGRRRSWIPLLMLAPLIYVSLRSGMKSEFVFVLLPVLLAMLKRATAARAGVLGGLLILMFVYVVPLTKEVRDQVWIQKEELGIARLNEDVWARIRADGPLATAMDSATEFVNRASSAEMGGMVMYVADRDGHIGMLPLEGLASIFIPRILWPDKPQYAPGAWFTWYLGHASSPEAATSATATMLGTELYWMFGWVGVTIGMLFLGVLYSAVWNFIAAGASQSPLMLAALFAFLMQAVRFEELATIYAISGPIIYLIYVKVLKFSEWASLQISPRFR